MQHPPLPKEIIVLHGTDVNEAWDRFQPFEALHHLHTICNPLTSDDLDALIDVLDPTDGDQVLDLACGHGELLHRLTRRVAVGAIGVDLSPWALTHALAKSTAVAWWLGDAAAVPEAPDWDIVTCLGASWIWNGFEGTASALAKRTAPGGRIALGDLRLRSAQVRVTLGDAPEASSLTEDEQVDALRSLGLEPVEQLIPDEAGWRAYHELVIESANAYAAAHPDDPSADHRAMAHAWMRNDYERLKRHLVWTIWVADTPA